MKKFIAGFLTCLILVSGIYALAESQQWTALKATFDVYVSGQKFESDKPIVVIDGSTYLPLKAIGEVLGVPVVWNGKERRVEVGYDDLYTVTRVVDGDTIEVVLNAKTEKVRLIGIDTPESVHPDATKNLPEGKTASEFARSKLEGKEIELEFDVQERDQYGRLLAYVYLDNKMFNKTLLEEGYARVATYPPNVKYVDEFVEIQKVARENNKGFWSGNVFNGETSEDSTPKSSTPTPSSIPTPSSPPTNTPNNRSSISTPEPVKTTELYVGSVNSNKYHLTSCRYAKDIKISNLIYFDSAEEAKHKGYEPCQVCKP